MSNLKYCHVVNKISPAMKEALEEVPRRGGMYNWLFLFKGEIRQFNDMMPEDYERFDVIQVNLSPVDQVLIKEIRDRMGYNTSTLLIANNDYVTEAWDTWLQHPLEYGHVQDYADAVFGTEPHQTSFLRDDAYCIPHPHWTKMLKHIGNDDLQKERFKVGALYHWWEGRTYHTSMIFEKLRREFPRLITQLYGYNGQNDVSKRWQKVQFDKLMPLMDYPNFQRSLMTNRFIYEPCTFHTYGRTTVDTAALGIPSIGSNRVFSMRHCWPNMSFDPFDGRTAISIMRKALTDEKWLQEQLDYAYCAVEYFSYEKAEERYLNMISETRQRLGK